MRKISTHALREEGDQWPGTKDLSVRISTHALREEGDKCRPAPHNHLVYFYPRPPRGGRLESGFDGMVCYHFYPRPPRGGRRGRRAPVLRQPDFYPRPPRGGRPADHGSVDRNRSISTHALREEGDKMTLKFDAPAFNFYPRPPRGGRRCWTSSRPTIPYFYPRPPRGGRRQMSLPIMAVWIDFYPRPPRGGRRWPGTVRCI